MGGGGLKPPSPNDAPPLRLSDIWRFRQVYESRKLYEFSLLLKTGFVRLIKSKLKSKQANGTLKLKDGTYTTDPRVMAEMFNKYLKCIWWEKF